MKVKLKISLTTVGIVLAAACEYVDITPGGESGKSGPVMAVAVEYPEGYNWRKDSLGQNAPAKLVLYKGWEREMAVDVGTSCFVSSDADMHRMAGGHLYTDYSTDSQTIIKCDGKEVFRYEGRESIQSIFIRDTSLYTLGINRSSEGWSYRENGRLLIAQKKGRPLSGLYEDMGSICFAYSFPLDSGSEGEQVYRYYTVKDDIVAQVVPAADEKQVTSIRVHNGVVNYLAISSSLKGFIWQRGNETLVLGQSKSDELMNFSLHKAAGTLYAHAQYGDGSSDRSSLLWKGDSLKFSSEENWSIYSFCEDGPRLCFVCSKGGRSWPLSVMRGAQLDTITQRFSMLSPHAFCCNSDNYYIGVNDREDNWRPLIVHNRDTMQMNFNGYFTHLSYN